MDKKQVLSFPPVVILLAFVCSLLWGSAFPTLKFCFSELNIGGATGAKLYFAAYRFLLAGLLLFLGIRITGRRLTLPATRDYWTLLMIGFLQTTLQYIFFYIGLANTTGMKAAIITASGSFFLALFSHWWIAGDTLNPLKVLGLMIGFAGVVLVNLDPAQLDFSFRPDGEGFILITSLVSVLAVVCVKKMSSHIHPPLMVAYQLVMGAVLLLGVAWLFDDPGVLQLTPDTTLAMVYLSVVSALAFSLWYLLVQYNQLTRMAVYRFLIPVCGTTLSAAFLADETLDWTAAVSLLLVSGGMVMVSLQREKDGGPAVVPGVVVSATGSTLLRRRTERDKPAGRQ